MTTLNKPITSPFSAVVADMVKLRSLPATIMTSLRFVGTPIWAVLIMLSYVTDPYLAVGIMAFLCVTDGLDGLAARLFNGRTHGGARFDEITDKVWSVVTFGLLVGLFGFQQNALATLASFVALIVFAGRDFHVSYMRGVVSLPSSWLGKVKTTLQMLSALMLLFVAMLPVTSFSTGLFGGIGFILLAGALAICIVSWLDYYHAYKKATS